MRLNNLIISLKTKNIIIYSKGCEFSTVLRSIFEFQGSREFSYILDFKVGNNFFNFTEYLFDLIVYESARDTEVF